jgi:hypothetical protein
MFLSPSYQTTIPENTEVGMSILKVSAMDRDENNRLFYTITAVENSISIEKFDMDSRTGMSTSTTSYLSGKYILCTLIIYRPSLICILHLSPLHFKFLEIM